MTNMCLSIFFAGFSATVGLAQLVSSVNSPANLHGQRLPVLVDMRIVRVVSSELKTCAVRMHHCLVDDS